MNNKQIPKLPDPPKPSGGVSKEQDRRNRIETAIYMAILVAIVVAILIMIFVVIPAQAAGPCNGGAYEGRPALQVECLHNREVRARQQNSTGWSGGGAYNCVDWEEWGGIVCYNDHEMCIPGGECYGQTNVEDYCEQYGDCTPPWVEADTDPYPYP